MTQQALFLPGLPEARILAAFAASPGNEIASGKFASPQSSAALAANAFGFFLDRARELPCPFAQPPVTWLPNAVHLEAELRFPWNGGRHPWLDALIECEDMLIGVESKRYEPYRGKPIPSFAEAYDRDVWGSRMSGYNAVRDRLRDGSINFKALDAAQLVKHAYGLRTAVHRDGHRGRKPVLLYVYAEPRCWPDGRLVDPERKRLHREEIQGFADLVAADEVAFSALPYAEMLANWRGSSDPDTRAHAQAMVQHFDA